MGCAGDALEELWAKTPAKECPVLLAEWAKCDRLRLLTLAFETFGASQVGVNGNVVVCVCVRERERERERECVCMCVCFKRGGVLGVGHCACRCACWTRRFCRCWVLVPAAAGPAADWWCNLVTVTLDAWLCTRAWRCAYRKVRGAPNALPLPPTPPSLPLPLPLHTPIPWTRTRTDVHPHSQTQARPPPPSLISRLSPLPTHTRTHAIPTVGDSVLRSEVAGRQVTSLAAHALGFDDYRMAAIKRAMVVGPPRGLGGPPPAPVLCELPNGDMITLPAPVVAAPECLFDGSNPGAVHNLALSCLASVDPDMRGG